MNRHNDQPIADILKLMIADLKIKPQLTEHRIRGLWLPLMGQTINNYTRSIRLVKGYLYIVIESAPLRQELFYNREKIKTMLNEELGEVLVLEVIVK